MPVDHSRAKDIIEAAYRAVEESGVPEALQEAAFVKAVDLLSGAVTPPPGISGGGGGEDGAGESSERAAKIAKRLGVEPKTLGYIYELDDDGVVLVVKRAKLASDKANAMREIAVLVCAARQAGGYDAGYTPIAEVRTRVKHYGVLDEGNFAAKIAQMTDWFAIKGAGAKRELKVTQTGYEEAAKIVNRITGGEK